MSIKCRECENDVYDPGVGVIIARLENGEIKEGIGYVICHSHFDDTKAKTRSLEDLSDGAIVILDERTGHRHNSGTLSWTQPTLRTKIIGYLPLEETRKYFPNTYEMISK